MKKVFIMITMLLVGAVQADTAADDNVASNNVAEYEAWARDFGGSQGQAFSKSSIESIANTHLVPQADEESVLDYRKSSFDTAVASGKVVHPSAAGADTDSTKDAAGLTKADYADLSRQADEAQADSKNDLVTTKVPDQEELSNAV